MLFNCSDVFMFTLAPILLTFNVNNVDISFFHYINTISL